MRMKSFGLSMLGRVVIYFLAVATIPFVYAMGLSDVGRVAVIVGLPFFFKAVASSGANLHAAGWSARRPAMKMRLLFP
jgi:hypothetical protein